MKQKISIGDTFGRLTTIKKGERKLVGKKVKKYLTTWQCKCLCGNIKTVKTIDLTRGNVRSCGCLKGKKALTAGEKKNRLTMISYKNGKWLCLCDCGEMIELKTGAITSNNTKSCGCLKTEISSGIEKIEKLIEGRRIYLPRITSSRRIWQSYYKDLTFSEFYELSQKECVYCGAAPSNKYNYFNSVSSRGSEKSKTEGLFVYNVLDKIDSALPYIKNNVVSCCVTCNRGKNNRNLKEFWNWVDKLKINNFCPIKIKKKKIKCGSYKTSLKSIFNKIKTDLEIEEYHWLSKQECYYCGNKESNIFNKAKLDNKSSAKAKLDGEYKYNSISAVDVDLGYIKNNIVTCCKWCNFTKNNLEFDRFNEWIYRVKNENSLFREK